MTRYRPFPDFGGINPTAVITDLDIYLSTLMPRPQMQFSTFHFSRCRPFLGFFESVIDCIADQMRKRVLDRLQYRFIYFRLVPFNQKFDLLTALNCQISNQSGVFPPDISDGLHSGLTDAFLQVGSDPIDLLSDIIQPLVLFRCSHPQQLISSKNQFTNKIHQLIE